MPTLVQNKKFHLNFDPLEEYEAGMELLGHEVKALKNKQGSLEGAHVIIRGDEAFLVNMHIPPYQPGNTPESYNPERPRRLLLARKEIGELAGFERQKGLTIVPISVYSKNRKIKIALAAAKGKKKYDKRQTIKARDEKRQIEREMKRGKAL